MNDPLILPTTPHLSLISQTRVPNVFPTETSDYRLAILGEAPGADEEVEGRPFIGVSGHFLDSILSSAGILRSACYVGNVCQYRPPGNDLSAFGWNHEKVQQGISDLKSDLLSFKPNCVLCLGNSALRAVTEKDYGLKDSGFSVSEYRGSIGWSPWGFKYVGAYHPAAVLRTYKDWPLLRMDCARAKTESATPNLNLPKHEFELDLTPSEICHRLNTWPSGLNASIDIEGGLNGWICLSVVPEANRGFIVAFGSHRDTEQQQIYSAVSRFLYRDDVPKVLQNSLYEGFVLGYGFGIVIRGITEDTMLKFWELYPELPKGLDTQGSIFTRQPQWKYLIAYSKKEQLKRAKAGVNPDTEIRNKHLACCIDSSVTLECSQGEEAALSPDARRHYRFNMDLLEPTLYMQLKGFAYNKTLADQELAQCKLALAECATRLEMRVLPMQFTKTEFSSCIRGAKGSLSDVRLKKVMYEQKGYPVQYKGRGPDKKITADVEALLNLVKKYERDPFLADVLLHRKLESIQETLEVSADPDGRVRCAYNLVGTETGRLTCYTSPTGSGANLQTITKKLRKLYTSDEGKCLFQCDLAGADGWTVAARCLAHGDSTMWEDYHAGLKPAKILALMYEHGADITRCDRETLRNHCKIVDQDGWLYFGCKRVQHGTNYGMQEKTMSVQIMKDSYKMTGQAIHVEPSVCAALQRLYLIRYPGIYQWHQWAKNQVASGANLKSASGHTRVFFGRRKSYDYKTKSYQADHETWKEFLSDEPQENTTYATLLALHRLWYDPENRIDRLVLPSAGDTLRATKRGVAGGLYIEPSHTVHDALLGQWSTERTDWARNKVREYFDNELEVANTKVKIPFEGAFGPSWGELGEKYGGGTL